MKLQVNSDASSSIRLIWFCYINLRPPVVRMKKDSRQALNAARPIIALQLNSTSRMALALSCLIISCELCGRDCRVSLIQAPPRRLLYRLLQRQCHMQQ